MPNPSVKIQVEVRPARLNPCDPEEVALGKEGVNFAQKIIVASDWAQKVIATEIAGK
jgi:hypothetical protein